MKVDTCRCLAVLLHAPTPVPPASRPRTSCRLHRRRGLSLHAAASGHRSAAAPVAAPGCRPARQQQQPGGRQQERKRQQRGGCLTADPAGGVRVSRRRGCGQRAGPWGERQHRRCVLGGARQVRARHAAHRLVIARPAGKQGFACVACILHGAMLFSACQRNLVPACPQGHGRLVRRLPCCAGPACALAQTWRPPRVPGAPPDGGPPAAAAAGARPH